MLLQSTLVAALGATAVSAVKSLTVKGNQFINPDSGDVFQIVGAAYQPGGSSGYEPAKGIDPLSNGDVCLRDAALMQSLGANTIRVYNLNPDLNHDKCASIFNAAGIYMLIDVNSPMPNEALNNLEPWTSYNSGYLNRTFAVVEAFKSYPNTLGFFSGNEVISDPKAAGIVPQYLRSVTRDIKDYVKKHADRDIPVGYSAADVRPVLQDSWNYLTCEISDETGPNSQADMFALNSYSWCGDATYTSSGYNTLTDMFQGSSVPVFFSEYGCNTPSPRVFSEVDAIYGDKMTKVFSGAVVYEYAMEPNKFGLAKIDDSGKSAELVQDFRTFQNRLSNLDWKSIQAVSANGENNQAPKCSAKLLTNDAFTTNFTMLPLPPGAQAIINKGVSPKPSGKIVDISSWSVTGTVKDVDGSVINNLAVVPLADDAVNTSGNNKGGSTTGKETSDSSSNSGDDTGAAPHLSTGMAIPVAFAVAIVAAVGLI